MAVGVAAKYLTKGHNVFEFVPRSCRGSQMLLTIDEVLKTRATS